MMMVTSHLVLLNCAACVDTTIAAKEATVKHSAALKNAIRSSRLIPKSAIVHDEPPMDSA
jgi:hypothetical protein